MTQQHRIVVNTLFALLATALIHTKSFSEPVNLYDTHQAVRQYFESGEYIHEVRAVATSADQYILREAKLNAQNSHPQKLAIVLDIDETSLSGYEVWAKNNFCYNPSAIRKAFLAAKLPPVYPILHLYQKAIKKHIAVFFVTGRYPFERNATIQNLKTAGYTQWTGLYVRPQGYKASSIAPYKTVTRATIEKQGYTIIASIGDQQSDLTGGHTLKTFKLPNPFYKIM